MWVCKHVSCDPEFRLPYLDTTKIGVCAEHTLLVRAQCLRADSCLTSRHNSNQIYHRQGWGQYVWCYYPFVTFWLIIDVGIDLGWREDLEGLFNESLAKRGLETNRQDNGGISCHVDSQADCHVIGVKYWRWIMYGRRFTQVYHDIQCWTVWVVALYQTTCNSQGLNCQVTRRQTLQGDHLT